MTAMVSQHVELSVCYFQYLVYCLLVSGGCSQFSVCYLLVSGSCSLVSVVPVDMGCLGEKTEEERLDEKTKREANKKIERQLQKERQAYKATHRLLLLGETPVSLPSVSLLCVFLSDSILSVCRRRRIR